MAKMLMINADKCIGCHSCEAACSMAHEGSDATRIGVYTWGGFSAPMMCQQCRDAPCIKVCTPHAMTRNPVTGWVELDQAKCIGCRMCVQACPFGSAVWDEESHKVLKCDNCGGDPACAKSCPSHALEWVDDVVATRTRKRALVEKFKRVYVE